MNKKLQGFFLFSYVAVHVSAQSINPIVTAVPLLLVTENAQAMGMAQIGVVASPFYYQSAITQNPALLARNKPVAGVYFSHVPWMRTLVPDLNILTAGGHYSKDGINAFSYTFIYLPTIWDFYESYRDFYHTASYAKAFSKNFSVGTGLKHIQSRDIWPLKNKYNAFACDIGVDYRKIYIINEQKNIRLNAAASVLNVGTKLTKNAIDYFLPANLMAGLMGSYQVQLINDKSISLDCAYQVQKLLVPTPPLNDEATGAIVAGMSPDVSVFKGVIQSFYDAPGGLNEEIKEIAHQFGTEVLYTISNRRILAFRAGGFLQNEMKGYNKFLATGASYGLYGFTLDVSYLIPLKNRHPLAHTICYTLGFKFNMEGDSKFRFSN